MKRFVSIMLKVIVISSGFLGHTAMGEAQGDVHAAHTMTMTSSMSSHHQELARSDTEVPHEMTASCEAGSCAMICGFVVLSFDVLHSVDGPDRHAKCGDQAVTGLRTSFDPPPPKA